MKKVDIHRVNDIISFEPPVLSLKVAADRGEIVVFRNFDRKAGHWIMPVGGQPNQWFPQRLARCTDPANPPVSSHLVIFSTDGPSIEYTCSMHPDRDPPELGTIEVN